MQYFLNKSTFCFTAQTVERPSSPHVIVYLTNYTGKGSIDPIFAVIFHQIPSKSEAIGPGSCKMSRLLSWPYNHIINQVRENMSNTLDYNSATHLIFFFTSSSFVSYTTTCSQFTIYGILHVYIIKLYWNMTFDI